MKQITVNGAVDDAPSVPKNVAKCPECGGELYVSGIDEWETGTGKPTEGGVSVSCINEPDIDDENQEGEHRWWQGEWMPVIDRVTRWARRHIRVREVAA